MGSPYVAGMDDKIRFLKRLERDDIDIVLEVCSDPSCTVGDVIDALYDYHEDYIRKERDIDVSVVEKAKKDFEENGPTETNKKDIEENSEEG
jgi:hypothetical protein